MASVCLVYPNDDQCYKFARGRTRRMPMGLAYVAAALRDAGHAVRIVDGALHNLEDHELVQRVLAGDPEFVGIGCTTPLFQRAVAITAKLKALSAATRVVLGGPHVTALPEASLRNSAADFVVVGEGEESLVAIIDCVRRGGDPAEIPGIAFRRDATPVRSATAYRTRLYQNENAVRAIDLNKVPIPARELFEWQLYTDHARGVYETQTSTVFGRGCPGKCLFCNAGETLVRLRDLQNIMTELRLIQEMGIRHVFVNDDTYTMGKARVLALSQAICREKIRLNLSVQLRLDQIDEEVCDALYASGVRQVGPGIESGNEEIIRLINKGLRESKDHIRKQMKLLRQYDWTIRCSYVMGMPGETEAQMRETIEFARELEADENAFSIVVPYPGTALWDLAKARGRVHDDMNFECFLYYHDLGCNLSAVPDARLIELHELAYTLAGNAAYQCGEIPRRARLD